jgi:hypothetical protein
VSEALSRAVAGEKRAHHPRIIFDDTVGVGSEVHSKMTDGFSSAIPTDDGMMMVLPFVPDYGSADPFAFYDPILDNLLQSYRGSRHEPKYAWMKAQTDRAREHWEALAEMEADRFRDDFD